ncbi:MotA/TolQ/ExbB proton channel family protein [Tropicibacter sp. R16_0]|uniref:MotA/TolQ/ExbB proton channel family protein n=1 Tax=Tropicibacter sp. R16_0 TaxID=2821102 RepID=UPI001ADA0CA4|nr:MotA/TolQ/ExbB proton channel family protein [Tropicibacter sp. R16_0]MBO9453495.1 MotA/TolQ/ExbB proton channel family protein [Tropicibacter sp. R16_0]
MDLAALIDFLTKGGPALWAIAFLSVLTVAIGLWRVWGLSRVGVWSRTSANRPSGRVAKVAKDALQNLDFDRDMALNEVTRIAKRELSDMRRGIRALELIATIAPLIGLLGTVLGMIQAFQALQEAGSAVDPAILAGGIWEALLTTAAGMAVAIPASVLVSWFEGLAEQEQADMEDAAMRVFNSTSRQHQNWPAEAA